jgi:Phosphotransferase enzyme family
MSVQQIIVETIEYQLILALPGSKNILAIDEVDGWRLPSISIPRWTRHANQLSESIYAAYKLCVWILEFFHGSSLYAVAEVLVPTELTTLKAIALDQLQTSELSEPQRAQIASIIAGESQECGHLSRVGWIDEAIIWLESETGKKLSSKLEMEQYNAGGGFTLVRFHMEDGRNYWLKATGEPNTHEFSITMFLSKLRGRYLPELISSKPEWNAWLTSEEGRPITEMPIAPRQLYELLEDAVESMAELQIQTQGYNLALLNAGAFDQGLRVFHSNAQRLFDYLEEAMSLQTSTKVPRLEKKRIHELCTIFEDVCRRMDHLGIGDTLVHGDMNLGNILICDSHCQFIDWSETYLGNPLIALQHLLMLNKVANPEIRDFINLRLTQRFLDVWRERSDSDVLSEGLVYMPILAIASTLYGRGDWLISSRRNDPHRESWARSLARHMDRAAREPALREALCH